MIASARLRPETSRTDDAIRISALVKRYDDLTALDGVDVTVSRGGIHGLLGRNGAGKTSLLRILLGLVHPDAGTVDVLGARLAGGIARGVAGFVDTPRFYPYLSGTKNLDLLAALDGASARARVDSVLGTVGLEHSAGRKVQTYSAGMRQRLGLAAVLLRDPDLLVLDEPTTGLDPVGIADLHALLRSLAADGRTVLLSSHDMSEVERLCDSVTILSFGRVVYSGGLDELRMQAPAPSYLLTTSDDAAAARRLPETAESTEQGLVVRVRPEGMDGIVLALAAAGIAVRSLARIDTALEALFLRLTADEDAS